MSQLRVGALLSYISILISIIIALVYTPVMIRLLGQSDFGLYSLIGSLAAYFSVMDMGLGNAMVRFGARNRIKASDNEKAKLNGMFLTLYTIIGILTVIVGLTVYSNVDILFGNSLSVDEIQKAKTMIIILIINFAITFPLSVFTSILRAYEKFVLEGILSITRIIMSPILIIPSLLLGYGVISMVAITTVINVLCLLYATYYCLKHLKIKVFFGKIDISLLKEVLSYSFFVFLNVIVDQFFWKTDQMILGILSGTSVVAVYAIAMQFITLYMRFSTAVANLFLPKVSMMEAKGATNEEFTNEMIKFGRIQFLILALIISGFFLYGYDFIVLWAGNSYEGAYVITLILMVPLTIPLIQNIGISILQAKNKHAFRSIVYVIVAFIKVLITVPFVKYYGSIGAAVATVFSLLIAHAFIMNIYYYKAIGINIINYWKNIGQLLIPIIASVVIGYLLTFAYSGIITWLILGIYITQYTLLYCILIWYFGMNNYEKKLIKGFVQKLIIFK